MHTDHDRLVPSQTLTNHQSNGALPEREITEPAQRGAGAETERQRLFSLLNELPGIVYLRAPYYAIHLANRNFRQHFGDPASEPCFKVIHSRTAPCEPCGCATALSECQLLELEWAFADATSCQLYDCPFVGAFVPVTAREAK